MCDKKNAKYPLQKCQDETVKHKFDELHVELVDHIVKFCKENDIMVDNFSLTGDGLKDSIKFGEWTPFTDSCLCLGIERDGKPFLMSC